jgi:cytochrome c-type protein NapB
MNKTSLRYFRVWTAALVLCLTQSSLVPEAFSATTNTASVKLQTLRGADIPASDPEGEGTRFGRDQPPLPRDFVQQPPLIPHTIKGYAINMNFNKCLDCHAWSRAKESGATKISVTHFKDRDGMEMSSVSPRRYFCVQCHVPQSDAAPLVGNAFKPGTGMR